MTEDKYFTYLYKTNDYSGTLISETDEGTVFWASLEEINNMQLAPNFREYLPVFFAGKYTEAYCSWNDEMKIDQTKSNPWGIVYRQHLGTYPKGKSEIFHVKINATTPVECVALITKTEQYPVANRMMLFCMGRKEWTCWTETLIERKKEHEIRTGNDGPDFKGG